LNINLAQYLQVKGVIKINIMQVYTIKGMGCTGCATTVEQRLSKVAGVTAVKVDFNAQKAFVESKEEVSLPALQKALEGTDYTIKKD
jgi:copper-exporting ATPase